MSIYSYKALDVNGAQVKGKITADNEAELENKLKQSGLDLLHASIVNEVKFLNRFGGVSLQEIILICLHLHHLEKAGVPILDSIGDLRDTSTNPKVKEVMMDLYDSLKNGLMLSEAMAKHPKVFDNIFIGLIKTGERTGNLAEVFEHLENHYKWVIQLHKKVKKATYYPLFLFVLMSGVIGLMMGFVIPKITVFLVAQNIPLPVYTVALINTSNFILKNWAILLSTPIAFYILVKFLCSRSLKFACLFDRVKLKSPVIGKVIRKIEIARFCHFFGIMFKSGIGILECLQVSSTVVSNLVIRDTILEMKFQVSEGKKLTKAIQDSNQFPILVVRMFKVGEDSGNLDRSMENINIFYDEEVNQSIDNMVAVLQPALTFMMGGLLMWVTLSIFGPIYGSFGVKK